MQLIIDIPDEDYNVILANAGFYKEQHWGVAEVWDAIVGGAPLPEGHGDLIDRDKFKSLMGEYFIDTSRLQYEDLTNAEHFNLGIENCFNEIDEMVPVIGADKGAENEDSH